MNPFNFAPPSIETLAIIPVAIVALIGVLALIIEMLRPKKNNDFIVLVSLVGLVGAAAVLVKNLGVDSFETGAGMILLDSFGTVLQLTIVITAALTILFSESYLREKRIPFGEFYPLILWSASGAMLMSCTTNLLMIFLGLEVLSISLYVMAGMSRREEKSEESALKYFLLGAFASGFLLYGISFIYGATGSLNLVDIKLAWINGTANTHVLLLLGLALMLIGLSFKASLVPFHQWTPDVYQGAPTNVTAFMAAGSKIGAIAALWRVLDASLRMGMYWIPALSVIAVLTMTIGNLVALTQKDVKRTLAYSSIAHAGYILVGILAYAQAPQVVSQGTIAYYLLSYSLMTVGAFAVVSLVAKSGEESTKFESLNGLYKKAPIAGLCLVVFVASLIGIPPTSGFFGKLLIFQDALHAGMTPLAIALAINSAISVYYYLGIVYAAVIKDPAQGTENEFARPGPGVNVACVLCAAGVIAAAVFLSPLSQSSGIDSKTPVQAHVVNPSTTKVTASRVEPTRAPVIAKS